MTQETGEMAWAWRRSSPSGLRVLIVLANTLGAEHADCQAGSTHVEQDAPYRTPVTRLANLRIGSDTLVSSVSKANTSDTWLWRRL